MADTSGQLISANDSRRIEYDFLTGRDRDIWRGEIVAVDSGQHKSSIELAAE